MVILYCKRKQQPRHAQVPHFKVRKPKNRGGNTYPSPTLTVFSPILYKLCPFLLHRLCEGRAPVATVPGYMTWQASAGLDRFSQGHRENSLSIPWPFPRTHLSLLSESSAGAQVERKGLQNESVPWLSLALHSYYGNSNSCNLVDFTCSGSELSQSLPALERKKNGEEPSLWSSDPDCYLLAVWLWASHWTSLCLNFLPKMRRRVDNNCYRIGSLWGLNALIYVMLRTVTDIAAVLLINLISHYASYPSFQE